MKRRGFTLIELLVVIGIIALLVSILVPSLSKVRNMAREVICRTNLHTVYLGSAQYAGDNNRDGPWAACEHGTWPWMQAYNAGIGGEFMNPDSSNPHSDVGNPAMGLTPDQRDTSWELPPIAGLKTAHYMGDAKSLFCPLFKVNYKANYCRYGGWNPVAQVWTPDKFWGTYAWCFGKEYDNYDLSKSVKSKNNSGVDVNNRQSDGVIMTDFYDYNIADQGQQVATLSQSYWHWNAAKMDGSALLVSHSVKEFLDWMYTPQPAASLSVVIDDQGWLGTKTLMDLAGGN